MRDESDESPYDGYYTPEERRSLRIASRQRGVEAEIGAARVTLLRLLASNQLEERPELLLRAVDAIIRAIKVRHQISGEASQNLLEAADRILLELGMGE